MARLLTLPVKQSTTHLYVGHVEREQLAAQIVAIMKAHFARPGPEEMKAILACASHKIDRDFEE
jgi:hypothetical protein